MQTTRRGFLGTLAGVCAALFGVKAAIKVNPSTDLRWESLSQAPHDYKSVTAVQQEFVICHHAINPYLTNNDEWWIMEKR